MTNVKISIFSVLLVGILCFYVGQNNTIAINSELHTILETLSTVFAMLLGILLLISYYSKKTNLLLFLACGFIGASVFDLLHTFVTSSFLSHYLPTHDEALSPWSWLVSRIFLSVFICLGCFFWFYELKQKRVVAVSEKKLYSLLVVSVILVSVLFFNVTFTFGHVQFLIFKRPQELIPAFFFVLAFVGFLMKKSWKVEQFEFYLLVFLFINIINHLVIMSMSSSVNDTFFTLAHLIKIISYVVMFVGVFTYSFNLFQLAEFSNRELIASAIKLKSINADLDSFTNVASHDLKAPLRGITQLVGWIEEDLGDLLKDDVKQNFNLLKKRVLRMSNLVDDLLEYSRVGKKNYKEELVDVEKLLKTIVECATNKNIELIINNKLPTLLTQKPLIDLVFRNLIGNAIKHSDKPNIIITVSSIAYANKVEFFIHDNGPGIAPEHHQRIFEMFQTLNPKDEVEGSGIGLSLVKKTVELVGGRIDVSSNTSQGCTFRFVWVTNSII